MLLYIKLDRMIYEEQVLLIGYNRTKGDCWVSEFLRPTTPMKYVLNRFTVHGIDPP